MRAGGHSIADDERVGVLSGRIGLRQKQRGEKERVGRKLHDTHFPLPPHPADNHPARLQLAAVLGIDAIVAVIAFGRLLRSIEGGRPRIREDGHRLPLPHERTCQRRDDQAPALGIGLCVIGVLEPEDVARELNDRVLKTPSGSDQRYAALACIPNRTQRPSHASVRARRSDPEAIKGRQAFCRIPSDGVGADPREVKSSVSQGGVCELMRNVARAEVADDADSRTNHVCHSSSISQAVVSSARSRPPVSLPERPCSSPSRRLMAASRPGAIQYECGNPSVIRGSVEHHGFVRVAEDSPLQPESDSPRQHEPFKVPPFAL